MPHCHNCGADLNTDTNFCSECGEDLRGDHERISDKRAKRVNPLIIRKNLGNEPDAWNNPWLARISSLIAIGVTFLIASWLWPIGNSVIAFILAILIFGVLFWYGLLSLAAHIDIGLGTES